MDFNSGLGVYWCEEKRPISPLQALQLLPIGQKDPRMKVEYEELLFRSSLRCSSFVFSTKVVRTVLGSKEIKYFSIVLFVHSMLEFYFSTEDVCNVHGHWQQDSGVFDNLRLNYQIFKLCYFICPFYMCMNHTPLRNKLLCQLFRALRQQ